jgi:hypothetical protein
LLLQARLNQQAMNRFPVRNPPDSIRIDLEFYYQFYTSRLPFQEAAGNLIAL